MVCAFMAESIIEKLAVSYGIEPEYIDNWGRSHTTSLDVKKKILSAMAVPVENEKRAKSALDDVLTLERSRLTPPFMAASVDAVPKKLVFQIPTVMQQSGLDDMTVSLVVENEKGETLLDASYSQKDLANLGVVALHGDTFCQWGLPFPILKEMGYYHFLLTVGASDRYLSQRFVVAMCPDRAYMPPGLQAGRRTSGISLSLYGVRSQKNWGIGDLGDLKDIVDWVAQNLEGNVIGLNPLHAIFNRTPFNASPYLPISKFYRNHVYLDVPSMEDYMLCPAAKKMVGLAENQRLLSRLRASKTVEYEKVAAFKTKILKCVFEKFLDLHWGPGGKTGRGAELEGYLAKEGELLDNFATFCALDAAMHGRDPTVWTWPQWPMEYHRPDTDAVQQFKQEQWKHVLFYKYLQWQLEKQLAAVQSYAQDCGMVIGLYHDLALAIDRHGADFWAYRDYFLPDVRVGAPPDAFSQKGQDWGFPPPSIETLKARSYDLFIKEIRKNCAFGGALRIDHVMRFFRLYCIPGGASAEKGAYVSQPYEDLMGILTLESVRNKVVIIGEDLGTVPPYIREKLNERGIFSYRLLYFEKDPRGDFLRPEYYPDQALVTIATHDLPTFVGFWTHEDMEIRKRAGLFRNDEAIVEVNKERMADKEKLMRLSRELGLLHESKMGATDDLSAVTGELHNAVVGLLAMTPCTFFVLSQEDLLKDVHQQNLPGTTHEYPNWSLKMKYSIEELFSNDEAQGCGNMFRQWVRNSGRVNPQGKGEA